MDTPDLREVIEEDLFAFFDHQCDPTAMHMAAFTAKDTTNRSEFLARWKRFQADPTIIVRTIVVLGEVAGHVMSYEDGARSEVTYWLDAKYWGKGIATRALTEFLTTVNRTRPIHARAASDNLGSLKVLQKCGFVMIEESTGFANARGQEIAEQLLELR